MYNENLKNSSTKEEDSTDLENVTVNVDFFKAFTRGYLKEVKGIILENNRKILGKTVILTTGTSLEGRIFVGLNEYLSIFIKSSNILVLNIILATKKKIITIITIIIY